MINWHRSHKYDQYHSVWNTDTNTNYYGVCVCVQWGWRNLWSEAQHCRRGREWRSSPACCFSSVLCFSSSTCSGGVVQRSSRRVWLSGWAIGCRVSCWAAGHQRSSASATSRAPRRPMWTISIPIPRRVFSEFRSAFEIEHTFWIVYILLEPELRTSWKWGYSSFHYTTRILHTHRSSLDCVSGPAWGVRWPRVGSLCGTARRNCGVPWRAQVASPHPHQQQSRWPPSRLWAAASAPPYSPPPPPQPPEGHRPERGGRRASKTRSSSSPQLSLASGPVCARAPGHTGSRPTRSTRSGSLTSGTRRKRRRSPRWRYYLLYSLFTCTFCIAYWI